MAATDGAGSIALLQSVSILRFLENDPRPTFVLDLAVETSSTAKHLQPIFYNLCLRDFSTIFKAISDPADEVHPIWDNYPIWDEIHTYDDFRAWARDGRNSGNSMLCAPLPFLSLTWELVTVDGRWNVISARLGEQPWASSKLNMKGGHLERVNQKRAWSVDLNATDLKDSNSQIPGLKGITSRDLQPPKGISSAEEMINVSAASYSKLSETVRSQEEEIKRVTSLFDRIAKVENVGIYLIDVDGGSLWCNEHWFTITDLPRGLTGAAVWMHCYLEEEIPFAYQQWSALQETKKPQIFESRFRKLWRPPFHVDGVPDEGPTWIKAACYPDVDTDGNMSGVTCIIWDISESKWLEQVHKFKSEEAMERARLEKINEQQAEAELFQRQRTEDAIRARKQQEHFVDMTSHEIRNPLSSIIHCTDELADTLRSLLAKFSATHSTEKMLQATGGQEIFPSSETLSNMLEAVDTILFCTQHAKRVVDDILLLSKMNSDLVHITPVPVEAKTLLSRALKVFEAELRVAKIECIIRIAESMEELDVNWVMLDTTRILQILVNLIGNSVKFTRHQQIRRLCISMSASKEPPTDRATAGDCVYLPRLMATPERADDRLFLSFRVQDSGCGISDEGQKLLFQKFSQATARSDVQYGGSGLGLFISRQLSEVQGGQMGFASAEGQGSIFTFFVETKRAEPNVALPTKTVGEVKFSASQVKGNKAPSVERLSLQDTCTHLLLVEDNLVNQQVLTRQLAKRGYKVSIANHGAEALDHLKKTRFWNEHGEGAEVLNLHAVLMDVEMPVMDGLTCTSKIRQLEAQGAIKAHVPVIAISANARPQQVETMLAAGMDYIVSKPFRMPELIDVLQKIADNPANTGSDHTVTPAEGQI